MCLRSLLDLRPGAVPKRGLALTDWSGVPLGQSSLFFSGLFRRRCGADEREGLKSARDVREVGGADSPWRGAECACAHPTLAC